MTRSIREGLAGLLVVCLAGCTGSVSPPAQGSGGTGPSGSGGGVNPGSGGGVNPGSGGGINPGSGGGVSPGTGGGINPGSGGGINPGTGGGINPGTGGSGNPSACVPGIPGTTQIPRMTRVQYATAIKDLLGVTSLATDKDTPISNLITEDSAGSLTGIAWNSYLTTAEKIAAAVMANPTSKAKFITCDPAQATCLTDTIKAFGRKTFRRPLAAAEVTAFEGFNALTPKGTPAEVAEAILYAFLVSPSFIMLPELAADKEGTAIKLNSYEVATRLSFLLWNSVPDDALNTAADKNELQTKEQIRTQAQRMLMDPAKAGAVATTFHRYYADIQPSSHWVNNTTHSKVPTFTAASYADAMAEVDAFFQDVVTGGGMFKDIFLSTTAFVTKATAPLYGLDPASYTTTPKKVALDATKRPGFLTRVGFLSTFSHEDSSSPILRGAFISGRVLGIPTGTPDPTVLGMTPVGTFKTNREGVESLTKPAPCNSCHTTRINPPGFVLERYNAVGAWQDTDPLGGAINSTADVVLSPTLTKTVSTPAELMAEIAKLPSAQRLYAQHWVAYATGRGPNSNDACVVDQLAGSLAGSSYSIASMMADFTQADSFRLRTAGN